MFDDGGTSSHRLSMSYTSSIDDLRTSVTYIPRLCTAKLPHINIALWDRSPPFSQVSINAHTRISRTQSTNKDSFHLEVNIQNKLLDFQDIKTGKNITLLPVHLPLAAMA